MRIPQAQSGAYYDITGTPHGTEREAIEYNHRMAIQNIAQGYDPAALALKLATDPESRRRFKAALEGLDNLPKDEKPDLESYRARKEAGGDLTLLMEEMERVFKIPARESEAYNRENPEIMGLYREIAAARPL